MSLHTSRQDNDKVTLQDTLHDTLQNVELQTFQNHAETTTSLPSSPLNKIDRGRHFLRPPVYGPIRPLSPDAISNLSVEEYEQLHEIPKARTIPLPNTWKGRVRGFFDRNLGLIYMLVAQIFGTMMNVTTRFLEIEGNNGKGLHPFQILFARMGITVVFASGYMWYKKTPHFPFGLPEVRLLLVCRGLGGFFGVFGMYFSLLYLPLADSTVITFLAPGLSCWLCSKLLNEPFTRIEKLGTLVSFIGVMFIARPTSLFQSPPTTVPSSGSAETGLSSNTTASVPDASDYNNVTPAQHLEAVGVALIGVVGSVCAYTTIRWIGRRAHPLISVNYFAIWCTIVSVVAQIALPDIGFLLPANLKEWGLLMFLGSCGFIMQFLLAAGLAYEQSSRATNMIYTQMLFALGFDKFFFGTTPDITSIIGSTLILGSAVFVALQHSKLPLNEEARNEGDLEEAVGLMGRPSDDEANRLATTSVQEVQLQTLR